MNVVLQTVIKMPGLADYFLNELYIKEILKKRQNVSDNITNRLGELFR